jgi:hypothetical protein
MLASLLTRDVSVWCDRAMLSALRSCSARWAWIGCVTVLSSGMPNVSKTLDCSDKFPVGLFALTPSDVARVAGAVTGFSSVYVAKRPVPMEASAAGDPCEFVYGFDVFRFTDDKEPGALVAGCRGDFDGDGDRDYVVLLRRRTDGVRLAYAFLARGGTFKAIEIGSYGDPPAWSGPHCSPRPQSGIFEAPDFEGTGGGEKVRVIGDLITMGWFTYYWRPELNRFGAILTTD